MVTLKDDPADDKCITKFEQGVQLLGLITIIFINFCSCCSYQTVTF